jgi:hypothetical protein
MQFPEDVGLADNSALPLVNKKKLSEKLWVTIIISFIFLL